MISEARDVSPRTEDMLYLGALSWAAALIHVLIAVPRLRESTTFGVLFVMLAAAQVVWGAALPTPHPVRCSEGAR
ncbi:MAG: hypothetical protein H0U06_06880 [Solirubrobacterales bacterium]|nr:hypothetical protein [Solirubrobacterales bacterium]